MIARNSPNDCPVMPPCLCCPSQHRGITTGGDPSSPHRSRGTRHGSDSTQIWQQRSTHHHRPQFTHTSTNTRDAPSQQAASCDISPTCGCSSSREHIRHRTITDCGNTPATVAQLGRGHGPAARQPAEHSCCRGCDPGWLTTVCICYIKAPLRDCAWNRCTGVREGDVHRLWREW